MTRLQISRSTTTLHQAETSTEGQLLRSGPTDIGCFSIFELFVHKALMPLLNGSSGALDGFSPQVLEDLTVKSNGQTGLLFGKALANLVNVILKGKMSFEFRPYFFGAKLMALMNPDIGLQPIAV